ncbi:hypothetical protein B0H12DRAFT_1129466 [Mycena haematopus]|nr:hypothetical protein B0H12DRAFT_1129466 [Mycena haematopus]
MDSETTAFPYHAMETTTQDVDMFDLDTLDCEMSISDCSAPVQLPYYWWAPTQAHEAAFPALPPQALVSPEFPPISELVEDYSVSPPPSSAAYTIAPASIPPDLWLQESLRMDEDIPPRSPRKSKFNPPPSFDKPSLFAPRIRRTPSSSSGTTTWRRRFQRHDTKIVRNTAPVQISPEEVENIRKLRRESDASRHPGSRPPPNRSTRAAPFDHPSPDPLPFSHYFSAASFSSSSSSSDSSWDEASNSSTSESDNDDAVSETSSWSSSDSSSLASNPSARKLRLSPPPGPGDRLVRMHTQSPGLLQRLVNTIVGFWSA